MQSHRPDTVPLGCVCRVFQSRDGLLTRGACVRCPPGILESHESDDDFDAECNAVPDAGAATEHE